MGNCKEHEPRTHKLPRVRSRTISDLSQNGYGRASAHERYELRSAAATARLGPKADIIWVTPRSLPSKPYFGRTSLCTCEAPREEEHPIARTTPPANIREHPGFMEAPGGPRLPPAARLLSGPLEDKCGLSLWRRGLKQPAALVEHDHLEITIISERNLVFVGAAGSI